MILLSHPTGNTFVRALLDALKRHELLYRFYTTAALNSDERIPNWLPSTLRNECTRRAYTISSHEMSRYPWREVMRLVSGKIGWQRILRHETGWACVDAVYNDLDRRVGKFLQSQKSELRSLKDHPNLSGVYAYEDGALRTFEAARERGLQCFYDLPIAHWHTIQKLLQEEAQRWPQWEPTLVGTRDSREKCARKDRELELSDAVVVPSLFVRDSLPPAIRESKRVIVAEFGSPQVEIASQNIRDCAPNRPLRVLFAGSLSQRKGLADVFAAMKLLDRSDVELYVMGSPVADLEFYRREYSSFHYENTRPHDQVLQLMQSCDVFVLPSIVEGRALVQQEALACGLPLIVTPNAGGEDLIEEGRTGFLVPIRSPHSIAEKLDWFASHRAELPAMREYARAKALQYTWHHYGEKIVDGIRDLSLKAT